MKSLWGYNDFLTLLEKNPDLKNGIVLDTNVLVSATYDSDVFHERTNDLLDMIAENAIPLYCNVNVRAEFLEIQRRIIFTEALLSFEATTKKSDLPLELSRKLSSMRSNQSRRESEERESLRLSEREIKVVKLLMIQEETSKGNLWLAFSRNYIGNGLLSVWNQIVEEFGLNFLSTRSSDARSELTDIPQWEDIVTLMSNQGLSSSDAMIVNMFQASKLEAILSSDMDIGIAVALMKNKICILPDRLLRQASFLESLSQGTEIPPN